MKIGDRYISCSGNQKLTLMRPITSTTAIKAIIWECDRLLKGDTYSCTTLVTQSSLERFYTLQTVSAAVEGTSNHIPATTLPVPDVEVIQNNVPISTKDIVNPIHYPDYPTSKEDIERTFKILRDMCNV